MNDLKIKTIQRSTNQLLSLLKKSKNKTNILVENCISELSLGGKIIPIKYDTILYQQENNTLYLLLKNGVINKEKMKQKLEDNHIPFTTITHLMNKDKFFYSQNNSKDLVFAREKYQINKGIQNSKQKKIDSCVYYPNINGSFSLSFIDSLGRKTEFMKEPIRGIIDFDDQIIMMHKEKREYHPTEKEILQALVEENINVVVKKETKLSSEIKHKCLVKKK